MPARSAWAVAVAIALALPLAAPVSAQDQAVEVDPASMRALAITALNEGRAEDAAALADALIARDPDDAVALIIRARAALALGDGPGAVRWGARGFAAAGDGDERYAAARVVAAGHAAQMQDTRAQFWLRRAGQNAPSDAARDAVADDYRFLRQRNPLAISLAFGVSPSSNINNGSAAEVLILPGLPFEFVLDGEARALSGLQFSGGINLSYRLTQSERSITAFDVSLQGNTYMLSPEARELAPDARGSDYADISFTATYSWRFVPVGQRGPWTLSATYGQTWYENQLFLRFYQVAAAKTLLANPRNRFDFSGFVEGQDRVQDEESFPAVGGRTRWSHLTGGGDRLTASIAGRYSFSDIPDVAFNSVGLGGTYERAKLVGNLRLGVGIDGELREFPQTFYDFDGRLDRIGSVRLTVGFPDLDYYGFEPQVIFEASSTDSSVQLFDTRELSVDFGIRSSF